MEETQKKEVKPPFPGALILKNKKEKNAKGFRSLVFFSGVVPWPDSLFPKPFFYSPKGFNF